MNNYEGTSADVEIAIEVDGIGTLSLAIISQYDVPRVPGNNRTFERLNV